MIGGFVTGMGGYYPVLFTAMAIVFVAGMVLESLPVTIILAPILAPIAASVGVDPIHFSVIFLVGASIGFITPPYGLNLYVASGVTGVPYFRLLRYSTMYLVALITVWITVALVARFGAILGIQVDKEYLMPDDLQKLQETQIPTNLRLLLVVEEIAKAGTPLKPMQLSAALGLPKPTIHRLLQTAEAEGFLQRDLDGRSYGPGPRLRQIAVHTMSSERLRTGRLAILKAVAEEIGETCNLATPDREGMTYLDRVETKWPLRIQLPIGTQVPFHCTASGKMYLSTLRDSTLEAVLNSRNLEGLTEKTIITSDALRAELAETRKRGYSQDDEEFMLGMTASRGTLSSTALDA